MDYVRFHETFINYCLNTTPRDRLMKRNKKDIRLKKKELYIENHHILPESQGGTSDIDNMVFLLPEEHIFIHKIRYKAFRDRNDMLAVRFSLNGFLDDKKNPCKKGAYCPRLTKSVLNGYAWIRQNSSDFRKESGWQTTDGRRRISEARRGTMPVKDAKTGKLLGISVPTDHPKVLSGEWVHHSKGRKKSKSELEYHALHSKKEQNWNYSGIIDEELILIASELAMKLNYIPGLKKYIKYAEETGRRFLKHIKPWRFNDGGLKGLQKEVEKRTGLVYDPYFRSDEQKEKLRQVNLGLKHPNRKDSKKRKNKNASKNKKTKK